MAKIKVLSSSIDWRSKFPFLVIFSESNFVQRSFKALNKRLDAHDIQFEELNEKLDELLRRSRNKYWWA